MATLYRTYRPQVFADLVGQDVIRTALQSAIAHNRTGHAYLFAGPRGTGKTTVARLLAKAVNCQKRLEIRDKRLATDQSLIADRLSLVEPCNTCQMCTDITEGRALDVIEIDAASNRGIDEMRELRDKIRFAPSTARKKVFIIDEVHMLTKEAFNALLKTLEEPPAHALFVLATTELHKVPVTISSRCQVFQFKKAQLEDLVRRLSEVATQEGLAAEPEALVFLARLAGGSYRDALSLLDQVASTRSDKLTASSIRAALGLAQEEHIYRLLAAIGRGAADQALAELQALESQGLDLDHVANQMVDAGRLLMHQVVGVPIEIPTVGGGTASWQELAKEWTEAELVQVIQEFVQARTLMKQAVVPVLPLEVAVVKLANSRQRIENREQRIENSSNAKGSESRPKRGEEEKTENSEQKTVKSDKRLAISDKRTEIAEKPAEPAAAVVEQVIEHPTTDPVLDVSPENWQKVVSAIRERNMGLFGLLQQAHFDRVENGHIHLHLPFQFAVDRLNDRKHRETLEQAVAEIVGQKLAIACAVVAKPSAVANAEAPQEVSADLAAAAMEVFGIPEISDKR